MSPDGLVAVVLAGGFGTRVKHLLPGIPKPMAPVAGKPFLEWVVRYLAAQGVSKVALSTGYLAEVIENHFRHNPIPGVLVTCAPETEPLGTAGGFLNAARPYPGNAEGWLVLNGDSLCFADLKGMLAEATNAEVGGVLLGCRMRDASRYGTLDTDSAGRLLGFEEKQPGAGVINAGMYLLRDAVLSRFPKKSPLSFELDVFPALAQQKVDLRVHVAGAPFLDIGTPETLPQAEAFVVANRGRFLE